jgi:hypothetical protein
MQDGIHPLDRLAHGGRIADVALDDFGARQGLQCAEIAHGQVKHPHLLPGLDQLLGQLSPDAPRAAGDQDLH